MKKLCAYSMNIKFSLIYNNPNNKIILKNTIGAFCIKGLALIISLLTTPALINYFGNNTVLGVWYTSLSVLIWVLNFDLGIGNGIRNQLVKDFTNKNFKSAKSTISSGLFSISLVTVFLTVVGVLIIRQVNLFWLYNVDEKIISYRALFWSSIFVFVAIMIRFMMTTISSIFYALQKSAINNAIALFVSILQLLWVLFIKYNNPEQGLISLSIAYIAIVNLPIFIAGIIIFIKPLKACRPSFHCIQKERIKKILGIGIVFFSCQIMYMFIANTNEFLVTNLYGVKFTVDYTFYYRLTSLVSMIVTLAMSPMWSVITKAMEEQNYVWLYKLYGKIKFVGIIVIIAQFLSIPFLQFFMDIWLGNNSIEVKTSTAIAFACFGSVFVYSGMLSTIVCGLARMKLQASFYFVGIIIKFIIDISLYKVINNWSLIVWSNVIVLLPYIIAQQIDLNTYLQQLTKTKNTKQGLIS